MIVDANIFKGFYQSSLGKSHVLCGCPMGLFAIRSNDCPIYHDKGQIIENEWRDVVDYGWFEAWYSNELRNDVIQLVDGILDKSIEAKIKNAGFPFGRDIVYIRSAIAVVNIKGSCMLYSEDIDMFDPKKKGCASKTRTSILKTSAGPIPKILKKAGVHVRCTP